MISRSRRDSVGGGEVVAEFFRVLAEHIRWGGGGVVAGIFSDLHKRNQMFTTHSVVLFTGRDTRFAKYKI